MRRVSTLCRTHKGANGIAVVTFVRVEYSGAADAHWVALVAVVQPTSGLQAWGELGSWGELRKLHDPLPIDEANDAAQ